MEGEKTYKLSEVAAELHRRADEILDLLEARNCELPKKPRNVLISMNWKLPESLYMICVQEFDRNRWVKIQEEQQKEIERAVNAEREMRRKEEMARLEQELLHTIPETAAEAESETHHAEEQIAAPVIVEPVVEAPAPVVEPVVEAVVEAVVPETKVVVEEPVAVVETVKEAAPVVTTVVETTPVVEAPPAVEAPVEAVTAPVEPTPVPEVKEVPQHLPLPKLGGFKLISTGTPMQRRKKPETPPTSQVKGGSNKKPVERKPAPEPVPNSAKGSRHAGDKKEKEGAPAAAKPATTTTTTTTEADGEKKWKRLTKLTKAEADEIVRVKSKALKERVAPAALPEMAKSRRPKPKRVDSQAVESQYRQTLAAMSEGRRSKKRRKRVVRDDGIEIETNVLRLTEFVTTAELANLLEVEASDFIKKCIGLGMLVTLNQRLDKDTIVLLAAEYQNEVEFITDEEVEEEEQEIESTDIRPRQPVVTVMGHVDHGKTTLLDYLRKTNVAGGEHGGITQHIGAYEVMIRDNKITFLDTPGHEAFTAMRARGAQTTDIVVLVVAADDQVMPQTLEAIDHAKAAGVAIVIAINKIDKPNAQPEVIKRQLADYGVLIEEWGGKYQCAEIGAKKGINIEKLLDEILIAAEIAEVKAPYDGTARGVVLESRIDKGRGTIATVLIQRGILKTGDPFVAGQQFGKVRTLLNEVGDKRTEAVPGQPVQVVGFTGIPQAGDRFTVYDTEREAKDIASRRQQQQREQTYRQVKLMTLEQFSKQQAAGVGFNELNVVIKGDADGSVEVLADSLMKLSGTELKVNVIRRGVGAITESDVLLAAASKAIIIGFHVHPNPNARELASREKVDVRLYRIIYEVVDDVRAALEGMLRPDYKEVVKSSVEVRETFKISRVGTIAGCYVRSGTILRSQKVRLLREGKEIWTGSLESLQRFKDSVKEVKEGFECGIVLNGFHDIKVGDYIESFETVAEARQLSEQLIM